MNCGGLWPAQCHGQGLGWLLLTPPSVRCPLSPGAVRVGSVPRAEPQAGHALCLLAVVFFMQTDQIHKLGCNYLHHHLELP